MVVFYSFFLSVCPTVPGILTNFEYLIIFWNILFPSPFSNDRTTPRERGRPPAVLDGNGWNIPHGDSLSPWMSRRYEILIACFSNFRQISSKIWFSKFRQHFIKIRENFRQIANNVLVQFSKFQQKFYKHFVDILELKYRK